MPTPASPATPSPAVPLVCDTAQIERALRIYFRAGDTCEIRALNCTPRYGAPHESFGYFREAAAAAKAVADLDRAMTPCGIYAVINPVDPALYARSASRFQRAGKGTATTDRAS